MIVQGTMLDPASNDMTFRVTVYGVPVGDDAFTQAFLRSKASKNVSEMRLIGDRMNPTVITAPELPACANALGHSSCGVFSSGVPIGVTTSHPTKLLTSAKRLSTPSMTLWRLLRG